MSTSSTSNPSALEPTLAITNCDSYDGQMMAIKLAEHIEKKRSSKKSGGKKGHRSTALKDEDPSVLAPVQPTLICLARQPEKCDILRKHPSCRVVQMSYEDRNSIALALRGILTVVLVPEMVEERVDWANEMVDVMVQEKVLRCVLISGIGTDSSKEHLARFQRVEDKVKDNIQRWTILRQGFLQQALLHWIPMIQDQGYLGMPVKPDVEFSPLDIGNLAQAVISITLPPRDSAVSGGAAVPADEGAEIHDGQIYTLTGPDKVTGPLLVQQLNSELESEPHGNEGNDLDTVTTPVTFKQITSEEFRLYLISLRYKKRVEKRSPRHQPLLLLRGILGSWCQCIKTTFLGRTIGEESKSLVDQSQSQNRNTNQNENQLDCPCDDPCKDPEGGEPPMKDRRPVFGPPNDAEVALYVDLMAYIDEGRATFQSGDLEKITGERGVDTRRFFRRHGRKFRERPTQ